MAAAAALLASYAVVNGLRMYYEVHGAGPPLVLLHGGKHTIESSFAKQIPEFSRTHRVIAIEQMGHGRTPDVPGRPLTYEGMTEDTAALLGQLSIRNADVVGWSDGGQIALRLAATHPDLVRRVVASGVGFGATEGYRKRLSGARNLGKFRDLWSGTTWGFTVADLARIKAPVMIVSGDQEDVEEATRVYRAIRGARLYIVPGTGHSTFQQRPEWLNPVILDFLSATPSK